MLIFLRVPIAVALGLAGLLGYAAIDGWHPALKMFGLVPYQLASAYSLSVIPLFILMGAVAARGKMATELFQACNAVFSGIRGALANATIGACALFGAICGSSIATAATFSRVAIPEMRRHGYDSGICSGRSRLGRHPRRPDPAVRVDRDLCHRCGAVAGPALCRGLHSGLRACRSLRA